MATRGQQCSQREAGKSHVVSGGASCFYCGEKLTGRKPVESTDVEFTDEQIHQLEFLRVLWRTGRI